MIIQILGAHGFGQTTAFEHFIEKRNGSELRLGKRLIGWNLRDTVLLSTGGVSQNELRGYVRHFAAQRHVVFESPLMPAKSDPFLGLAREVKDYLFAFIDTPFEIWLRNIRAQSDSADLSEQLVREQWLRQLKHKEQFRNEGYGVVTLRHGRSIQQIEALLLSARFVSGCYEALTLPKLTRPRRASGSAKTTKAA
ncbi:MAG: hypothetical protein M3Z41_09040 [Candidatus Eremiobacteraeota bacterium]|nr:hypothetical protein [Candidatus Eremiobacteraeota bacterium]